MKALAPFAAVMTVILLIFAASNMSSINGLNGKVRSVESMKRKVRGMEGDIQALEASRKEVKSLRTQISALKAKISKLEEANSGVSEDEVAGIVDQKINARIARAQDDLRNQFNREMRELRKQMASSDRQRPRGREVADAGKDGGVEAQGGDQKKQQDEAIRKGMEAGMDRMADRLAEQADLTDEQTNDMRKMMSETGKVWQEVMAGNMTRDEAREKMRELRGNFEKTLTDDQKESFEKMNRWGGRGGRRGGDREGGDRRRRGGDREGGDRRHGGDRDGGGDEF